MIKNPNIDITTLSDKDTEAIGAMQAEIAQADRFDETSAKNRDGTKVAADGNKDDDSDIGRKTNKVKRKVNLMKNKEGKPYQTIDNFVRVLLHDPKLAGRFYYDTRSYTKMVVPPLPWGLDASKDYEYKEDRPVQDYDYSGFLQYTESVYELASKSKAIDAIVNVSMANPRNPITEWLDSLEWDKKPRIATLLTDFLGAENSTYNAGVMRLFMLGAVARAYKAGIKFDYMPVLIGKQGIGKSLFVRLLAHSEEWYLANLPSLTYYDKAVEKLRGMWIVEVAELLATKKVADVEAVKAFVTTQVDSYRVPYGRETEHRKRTCVFMGTSNDPQPLTDKTGNRRDLIVRCGMVKAKYDLSKPTDISEYEPYFNQVWAEATYIFRTEHPLLVLDDGLKEDALAAQEAALEETPLQGQIELHLAERLEDWSKNPNRELAGIRVCAAEIIDKALSDDLKKGSIEKLTKDVNAIMRKIDGWVEYPKNHGRARCDDYGKSSVVCFIPEKTLEEAKNSREP